MVFKTQYYLGHVLPERAALKFLVLGLQGGWNLHQLIHTTYSLYVNQILPVLHSVVGLITRPRKPMQFSVTRFFSNTE